MQPTAPRRYFYDVDARAAREYWSIKPLARTDRKIVPIAVMSRRRKGRESHDCGTKAAAL